MKKIIIVLALAVSLTGLSFLNSKNEVCCMFASTRTLGWPLGITISKVTESYDEALKVNDLGTLDLLSQGWRIDSSSYLFLILNFIFYSSISTFFLFMVNKMKSIKK